MGGIMNEYNFVAAESILRFWLRQSDGGAPPPIVPMTPALAKFVDHPTAQKIWSSLLARLSSQPISTSNDAGSPAARSKS